MVGQMPLAGVGADDDAESSFPGIGVAHPVGIPLSWVRSRKLLVTKCHKHTLPEPGRREYDATA